MANHSPVLVTQHYASGPPALVRKEDDGGGGGGGGDVDTLAIEKQEEWIKKRKVEQITTKQVETRVKRQVVVDEDGNVVDDSGPQVTSNTSEDTQTKREEHTEKKDGDDGTVAVPEGWAAAPGVVIVREKHEKKSNTRDEIDERLETEQVHHLGQITSQELQEALDEQKQTGKALVLALKRSSSGDSSLSERQLANRQTPYSSPVKILHQSRKHKRIVDQENVEERSEEKDGRITTETKKHEHHEEVEDEEVPDDEDEEKARQPSDTSSVHEITKQTRNHYTTVKDEDQVEYLAVPKGGDLSSGVRLGRGPKSLRTVEYTGDADVHPAPSVRPLNTAPPAAAQPGAPPSPEPYNPPKAQDPAPEKLVKEPEVAAERTDALTKKPLDLEEEEETRKQETNRWLENHFGSETSSSGSSGSSRGHKSNKKSDKMPSHVSSGGISVTMVSDPMRTRYEAPDFPAPAPPFVKSTRPLGAEQIYGVSSPPQSPVYKSMPYQMNGKDVKRTGSFNHSNAYSWMNKEELKGHSSVSAARQNFLSSMNAPEKAAEPVTYSQPIVKRWPPPKQLEDEEIRTSTPVYSQQGGSTIIRLGPSVEYSTPIKKNSAGINRTQSLVTPSRGQTNNNSTSRMNLLNSSLQSVPERENRSENRSYFVDVERSFQGTKLQSNYHKTPPPRPAPPSVSSHYGTPSINSSGFVSSSTPLRATESFRIVRSPQFADESSNPPVRPIRRKSKRAPKTDSGTQCNPQTIRNDIEQQSYQTVERSKPLKQYYLGEDPFNLNKMNGVAKKEENRPAFDQERPVRKTEVARSQTLPRRPSRPEMTLNSSSVNVSKNLNTSSVNLSSSRVFSDHERSLNETTQPKTRIVPIATEQTKENKPFLNKTISKLNTSVNRSQSFNTENQRAKITPVHSVPLRSVSIRAANSPLYKSTSFLNRINEHQSTFGALKSPGIVTSISKSQLDLNKSTNDLRESLQAQPNSALYTLPRKPKAPKVASPSPVEIGPATTGKVQPGISERLAQLSSPKADEADDAVKEPTSPLTVNPPVVAPISPVLQVNQVSQVNQQPPMSPTSPAAPVSPFNPGTRGESYSSLHRKRLQQQKAQQETVQVSSEAPPASLAVPEAPVQSVTPPPPPLPESTPIFQTSTKATHRSFRAPQKETIHEESEQPAKEELNELAPEARSFKDRIALLESAGIHYANPAQTLPRVVAGKAKVPPPPPPKTRFIDENDPEAGEKRQKFLEGLLNTAPELFMHIHGNENLKDMKMKREDVIDGKTNRLPRTPSPPTPASGVNKVYTSTPAFKTGSSGESVPLTPPPMLVRQSSPFGSQRELAIRRGSSNSNSSGIVPAVKIPAPVNYSETVRVRSNNDPDSQSDSVQSFSKKVEPFIDGFSSETKLSSSQTSVTRSEYTTHRSDDLPDAYRAIRPQQSGGVIIQVRGNGH